MKETGTWSKWSNITLSSGQSLRHLSFKTDSFEGREDLFLHARHTVCPGFFLKLQDDLLKADSIASY